MKKCIKLLALLAVPASVLLSNCDKKEDYKTDLVSDYMILSPGKYITYKMDSLRFTEFGQNEIIVSYEAKDVVDAKLEDGEPNTWRIVRYYRPWGNTSEESWTPQIAYQVTVLNDGLKVLEDNLTYTKLKLPVKEGLSWYGNALLPLHPLAPRYQFSNDGNMRDWEYIYENVDQPVTIEDVDYANTVTVFQVGDSQNAPVTEPDLIGYRNYSTETYAKGIGLVSRETIMWEYQPKNGDKPAFKTGFGIKLSITGHN
ncbi:hypothetical protein [Pseudoflavitalea rhizosphaerae]|uniref:hypothetical protein n=1 Tax=Pseudoflavitalea rhizosphaerae TaxID=1884793 RepID=UPI000F8EC0F4|nr:hypothetical protein [Pseudoflavitalea rhizosphaerae]